MQWRIASLPGKSRQSISNLVKFLAIFELVAKCAALKAQCTAFSVCVAPVRIYTRRKSLVCYVLYVSRTTCYMHRAGQLRASLLQNTLLSQIHLETFFSNLGMQNDFHLDGKTLYRHQFDFCHSKNPLCNVLELTLFTINRTFTFLFPS